MPTKKEILDSVEDRNYKSAEVKNLIHSVKTNSGFQLPFQLKKGDVYSTFSGVKLRPSVIIEVRKDLVVSIPLSQSENGHNLCAYKSRFFGDGSFSNVLVVDTIKHAKEYFLGVFENKSNLRVAELAIKNFYKKVLK